MPGGRERREVVLAHQALGGVVHGAFVDLVGNVRHEAPVPQRALARVVDRVEIGLGRRAADRVKVDGTRLDRGNEDVGGQSPVECRPQAIGAAFDGPADAALAARAVGTGKGRDLSACVNAGVGAAGAGERDGLADDLAHRPLDNRLHGAHLEARDAARPGLDQAQDLARGGRVHGDVALRGGGQRGVGWVGSGGRACGRGRLLLLPAAEVRAVVGDGELVAWHGRRVRGGQIAKSPNR